MSRGVPHVSLQDTKERKNDWKNMSKHLSAISFIFRVILNMDLLSIWSSPPQAPFLWVWRVSTGPLFRCKAKVEVCIVPVLSHNRWEGNVCTDIVEEGSPVIKQREQSTHIQCNDRYYVLWVLCHTGTQRFIHNINCHSHTPFFSRLWESCSGVSFWINKLFAYSHMCLTTSLSEDSEMLCFVT